MAFNSAPFWLFCAAVIGLHWAVPPTWRWAWLLVGSWAFYGSFGLPVLGVLAGLTAAVYAAAIAMERAEGRRRKALLAAAIGVPLAALVACKYLSLFWEAVTAAAGALLGTPAGNPVNILVPIGISFYVFKLLSYAIDVYRRHLPAERHAGRFALYVAYFPQILAGPIERAGGFLPQVARPPAWQAGDAAAGMRLVAWGLFKKLVVADRLMFYVGEVFGSPQYKSFHLVFAACLYYIQIYADFSGYTDISIGLSRMLGHRAPQNFNYPYLARSVGDFWSRWHMTLSSWLRDYLFLPVAYAVERRLPGDRYWGVRVDLVAYTAGVLVTFTLAGLWHGAAWTFAAWGALHGGYLVVSRATARVRRRAVRASGLGRRPRLHAAVQTACTFLLVAAAWILFRADSFDHAWTYVRYLQFKLPWTGVVNLAFDLAIVAVFLALEWAGRRRSGNGAGRQLPLEARAVGYALFVAVMLAFSVDALDPFIYFRF
jgi:D-alanyl-lipoteichoic acid acyltransferase DltB (MBOAT superfamily)